MTLFSSAARAACCGAVVFAVVASRLAAQPAGVLREVYTGISGNAVSDLTSHPSFPASPSLETIQPTFEAPSEFSENYGQRMRALLIPPVTGGYTFWIASDDGGALFLSTTDNPAQKVQIAAVTGWTSSREWTKEPGQQSAVIQLNANQRYYIEALQKEGGGGDNLAVRWRLPDGTIEEPIPGSRLLVYGLGPPVITRQPQNTNVVEGGVATFSVQLARTLGATYQWRSNGVDIPGANAATYAFGPVRLADSGARFHCLVANNLGSTNSAEAVLNVFADTTRPALTSVVNLGDPQQITVLFSEPVELASATNRDNYSINQGVTVSSASLGDDLRTVILTTSPMIAGPTYTLTVNNVRDRAQTPNAIVANSQRNFSLIFTPLDAARLRGATEPAGPSSRRTGLVITEIMYHPAPRADGRNLEFIELYNAQEWFEDISGWRLTGAIDYTFPSNTVMAARTYLVVAAAPADVQAAYNLSGVRGPWTGALQNDSGTVRLRNHLGAVQLEVEYADDAPYPAAADGAGHSLVLVRPSMGERQAAAWAASDVIGGSPGRAESAGSNPFRTVFINEFLAHTDEPQVDFIELFNYSGSSVNVGGCILTDDPATNKFVIPANTVIPARGFLALDQTQLGFALSAAGETLYLFATNRVRVIDAVRFGGQANGVATGRFPDGAPTFHELATPTPGSNNSRRRLRDVVINEIHYNPISGDNDDEFIELHNRGTNAVALGGWRLTDGISFTFPNNAVLPAGGYLVVANNAMRLRTNYPGLTAANTLGDYGGTLANGGERIALTMPDEVIDTNEFGVVFTNVIRIVVDEVTYGTGGRWGQWADGGGSSLERIDPRGDSRLPGTWADSDETTKSDWVTIEHTGVLDHGRDAADALQILLLGPGECLVDDVEVIPQGGANRVNNGGFTAGMSGWFAQGNQWRSGVDATGGVGGGPCLHIRASGRGDTGANRVRTTLTSPLNGGAVATIRARVRWLAGSPEILLRLRNGWLEATGNMLSTRASGTPGRRNSRAADNAAPAIVDVTHAPVLPAANASIQVSARVSDPDGLATLLLHYRLDPGTNFTAVSMNYSGAGFYSATIPGQAAGTMIAYYLEAQDNFAPRGTARFPAAAPERECLIRVGDTAQGGNFGVYRVWMTQRTVDRWSSREKLSNDPLDCTFVYGGARVVYNIGGQYGGSPYHAPGYNSPLGNHADYVLTFPKDDLLLNDEDVNLLAPGNGCCEGSLQREQQAYWTAYQLGLPFCYRRPVNVFFNGLRRGSMLMDDSQQPNGDMTDQWYPEGEDGNLHKIQLWFEFDDNASGFSAGGASLGNFTTTGGQKKLARYRYNWAARAFNETANDYTNLFALMDATTTGASGDAYTASVESAVDVDNWARTFAVEHMAGNPDSWGYGGGQNMYTYKPRGDTWKLMIWDIDFGYAYDSPTNNLFGFGDGQVSRMMTHPPFQRAYWRAYRDAVEGPLSAARANAILDARYNAFVAAGFSPENPQAIKNYIAANRSHILQQLGTVASPFTVAGPASFSTNRNLITLAGTAPIEVETITINGVAYRVSWTSVSNWTLRLPLLSGTNAITVAGRDHRGSVVPNTTRALAIHYTGAVERPEDKLVLNEIMYHPAVAGAGFVEIHNTSVSNAFDLSHWRVQGVDTLLPEGTVLEPGAFLVLAEDRAVFGQTYGAGIPVAVEFGGGLDAGGETLRLLRPGADGELVVDQVTFDDAAPWPAAADGGGPSLQLIDPTADNDRVANWAAVTALVSNPPQTLVTITQIWKYEQTSDLSAANWMAPDYNDAAWPSGRSLLYVETAALPAPKNTPLTLGRLTYYFRTRFTLNGSPAGAALKLSTVIDDGAVIYLNGQEIYRFGMPSGPVNYSTLASVGVGDAAYAGPFIIPGGALLPGENVLAVEVHQSGAGSSDIVFGLTLETTYDTLSVHTPGAPNSTRDLLTPFPRLWINELLPEPRPGATNAIRDRFGELEPWVELYNGGASNLNLAGYYLANNYSNLTQWAFPANTTLGAGQFLLVWLDGEAGETTTAELHAGFRAAPGLGSLALSRVAAGRTSIVDHLNYHLPTAGRSQGSLPDGNASGRRRFALPTPGGTNSPAAPPVEVFINEWMAGNAGFLADPADAGAPDYEDWFELHNAGSEPADLGDFYLTDTLTNRTKWKIPDGTVIPPGGHLLVWADEETEQNGFNADLHANFRLSLGGEEIGLFAPDGALVDAVTFGAQTNNVSQGRFPDGGVAVEFMTNATPRAANRLARPNTPPVLAGLGPRSVNEGALLMFTAQATDDDVPAQRLTFSLDPGAPALAAVNPTNGVFTWTPGEADGPGVYQVTLRVTDDGAPPATDAETFTITVHEVNNAPMLVPLANRVVDEGGTLVVTNGAADPDPGGQRLTYSFASAPFPGMTIDPDTGVITWTATESHGPGNHNVTIRVRDDGDPPLHDEKTLSVFVNEVNQPPTLAPIADLTVSPDTAIAFDVTGADDDVPAQVLSYALDPGHAAGAAVDVLNGRFTWTPGLEFAGTTNAFTVRVVDDGTPALATIRNFTITVAAALRLSRVAVSPEGIVSFVWPALPGRVYRVEFKDSLNAAAWLPLGEDRRATAAEMAATDPVAPAGGRFYRVRQVD